ncbi:MAG: PQQ-dependent sugar dehydrogenase [Flavobacteriales bacterium]|nr:PQQ-dependent sugar dehydrogenase [Flavobacteriales bacterium]
MRASPQPNTNHNGGDLDFGPDGLLYIPLGDGGEPGDVMNNARIAIHRRHHTHRCDDPDRTSTVPLTNPWANAQSDTLPEIWASGLRNHVPLRVRCAYWRPMVRRCGRGHLWKWTVGRRVTIPRPTSVGAATRGIPISTRSAAFRKRITWLPWRCMRTTIKAGALLWVVGYTAAAHRIASMGATSIRTIAAGNSMRCDRTTLGGWVREEVQPLRASALHALRRTTCLNCSRAIRAAASSTTSWIPAPWPHLWDRSMRVC